MKKKTILTFIVSLFLMQKILAQPNVPLKFLNAQPTWLHYSYSPELPRSLQSYIYHSSILKDNKVYVTYNLFVDFLQGYFVEAIDIKSGNRLWEDHFFSEKINDRKYIGDLDLSSNNKLKLTLFQENGLGVKEGFPPTWNASNYQGIDYCIENGTKCDSIVTDPLDKLNKRIGMPFLAFAYNATLNAYLMNVKNKIVYLSHIGTNYDKVEDSHADYGIYTLNQQGHLLDSTLIKVPLKYSVASINFKEYDTDKFVSLIQCADKQGNKDLRLAYFDSDLKLEKLLDISDIANKDAGRYSLSFADKQQVFLLKNQRDTINEVLKTRFTTFIIDHNGNKLEEIAHNNFVQPINKIDVRSTYISSLKKPLILFYEAINGKASKLHFTTTDGNGNSVLLNKFDVNFSIGFRGDGLIPIDKDNVLLSFTYADSTLNQYQYIPKWSMLALFKISSFGFTNVDEQSLASFSFYPNPTNNQLTIKTNLNYDAIRVHSIEGKLMLQLERQDNTLDVSVLPSGMYLFELLKSNKAVTRKEKFVKIE